MKEKLLSLRVILTGSLLMWILPSVMYAPVYLKLDGIEGESQAADHENEIDIHSMSWAIEQESLVAGGGAGKATFKEFSVSKELDKASPKLALACASGQEIPTLTLTMVQPGAEKPLEYLVIKLDRVFVKSWSTSGDADDRPTEEVAFYYNKISFSYTSQGADGSPGEQVSMSWDVGSNTGG